MTLSALGAMRKDTQELIAIAMDHVGLTAGVVLIPVTTFVDIHVIDTKDTKENTIVYRILSIMMNAEILDTMTLKTHRTV